MRKVTNFQVILGTVVLLCCSHRKIVNASQSDDLLGEDLSVFGGPKLTDGDYKLVRIQHRDVQLEDGNHRELRIRRSGDDVKWNMRETSVIRTETPIWVVWDAETIKQVDANIITDAIRLYENPNLMASIAMGIDSNNNKFFFGSIGNASIAPLSRRTVRSILTEKPHLVEEDTWIDESGEFDTSEYHILYHPVSPKTGKILLPPMGSPDLFKEEEPNYNKTSYDRLRRSAVDTVYPKVVAILDYNEKYTTIYEVRFLHFIMYTLNFWNSVNLRFRTLDNPKVQLRLTGIVVNMDRKALPFIQDFIQNGMLHTASRWFASGWPDRNIPTATWDMLVVQTTLKLCKQRQGGKCENMGIVGSANAGPQCRSGWSEMIALISDDKHYSGVETAAHEIGHMLGAGHDAADSPEDCNMNRGYIMAEFGHATDRPFQWSRCSKQEISKHLRKDFGDCLDDDSPKAHGDLVGFKYLPGAKISQGMQCESRGYSSACEASNVCQNLECTTWLVFCTNVGPALDGTQCPNGVCRNGECIQRT